jgi:hypothetical protein
MENYIITEQQRQSLVKYLVSRPYQEVFTLIQLIGNLTKLDSKINPNFIKEEKKPRNEKG